MSNDQQNRRLVSNRRAFHDYSVLERLEAGIELCGTEVKSLRLARGTLAGAYCQVDNAQLYVHGFDIPLYEFGNRFNHESNRPRRLLLHRKEIHHLTVELEQKGCAVIPLAVYLKRGRVKMELGICKGKRLVDKRETLKRRTDERDAAREISRHSSRG